jgi:hypothetical protein
MHRFAWWKLCVPKKEQGWASEALKQSYAGKTNLETNIRAREFMCKNSKKKVLSIWEKFGCKILKKVLINLAKYNGGTAYLQERGNMACGRWKPV